MAISYPSELPFDSIGTVVEIVRANEISARSSTFAHALWNVQGYAQKALLGEPEAVTPLASKGDDDADAKETDAVAAMEKLLATKDQPSAQIAIPWKLIAAWVFQQLTTLLTN